MSKKQLMLGNQAIARGLYEAGVAVVSSYPGTPSTEITEYVSEYTEIYSEWAPNEKVALEVAAGASVSGARAASCMKHVGLNVAADPLFTASYTGVGGGLVVIVADDPGMHSSQNEQDTRRLAIAAKVPCLEPSDSEECRVFTKLAFDISERFDTPVILRITTRVAHSQSIVNIEEREAYTPDPYFKNTHKFVAMPAFMRPRHVFVEKRTGEIAEYAATAEINPIEKGSTSVGVIASGICYQYAREAFDGAWFLKLGIVNPLSDKLLLDFCKDLDTVYVIEELEPIVEERCKQLGINVIGKDKLPMCGEYTVAMLNQLQGKPTPEHIAVDEQLPMRPPVMCAGCPHRGVHYILSKNKKIVTGDIGCYTLGALPPLESMHTCLCMGASIGMAHGFIKAGAEPKDVVAIIGDSTFVHSGITGLVNAVYNNSPLTLIILDNSTTGMTGHQPNPSTGETLSGEVTNQLSLEDMCRACGCKHVVVADALDMDTMERIIKEETERAEPSVIIARSPCILLKGFKGRVAYSIDQDKCKSCRVCLRIGCPSISCENKDGKPVISIDKAICNGCSVCSRVCKFGAIGV